MNIGSQNVDENIGNLKTLGGGEGEIEKWNLELPCLWTWKIYIQFFLYIPKWVFLEENCYLRFFWEGIIFENSINSQKCNLFLNMGQCTKNE